MQEVEACHKFLFDKLNGASDITDEVSSRIYADVAPQDTEFPFIVFTFVGSEDVQAIGNDQRQFTKPRFDVKAIGKGNSPRDASKLASIIDEVLQGSGDTTVIIDGVSVWISTVNRESPIHFAEVDAGVRYTHSGGVYEFFGHKVP